LVKVASDTYMQSKLKIKTANLLSLQREADSLFSVLNNITFTVATSQHGMVDANLALKTNAISSEISNRDKTIAATIFAAVVKNLEISNTY
jgi:hypothetical protein